MLAQRSWFDIIYLLGSASADPQIDGTSSRGTHVEAGLGTQSTVTAPPRPPLTPGTCEAHYTCKVQQLRHLIQS